MGSNRRHIILRSPKALITNPDQKETQAQVRDQRKERKVDRRGPHHPGEQTNISVRLVLTPLRGVDLDDLELAVLPVPVEDPLHTRPPTPLHAPPARPRAPHPDLRHTRDVDVRPVDPRVPPPRAPGLLSSFDG